MDIKFRIQDKANTESCKKYEYEQDSTVEQ